LDDAAVWNFSALDFGIRIRDIREDHKMSQIVFAEFIGIPASRIANWETGVSFPSLSNLRRLCKVANVSADALLDLK